MPRLETGLRSQLEALLRLYNPAQGTGMPARGCPSRPSLAGRDGVQLAKAMQLPNMLASDKAALAEARARLLRTQCVCMHLERLHVKVPKSRGSWPVLMVLPVAPASRPGTQCSAGRAGGRGQRGQAAQPASLRRGGRAGTAGHQPGHPREAAVSSCPTLNPPRASPLLPFPIPPESTGESALCVRLQCTV